MSRLIVRNIPNTFSENQLRKHFETVGEVTDVKIVFRGTKNRRFCFIGYKSESDA
jgi:multiple RNA-binding domain-containing protein 1